MSIDCTDEVLRDFVESTEFSGGQFLFPEVVSAAFEISEGHTAKRVIDRFEKLSLLVRCAAFSIGPGVEIDKKMTHIDPGVCDWCDIAANDADIVVQGARFSNSIDLSGEVLKGSLRLVGCIIDGDLILNRTQLQTLDISGTVILGGVYATYLKASGSVRMRRTVSTGPVDFGASEVGGVFDATDAICLPMHHAPSSVSWVVDRAMFSLSLAVVALEVRFNRARIYGGINVRSLECGKSMFFNDAIVRSPIATLEMLISQRLPDREIGRVYQRSAKKAETDIAAMILPNIDLEGSFWGEAELLNAVELPGVSTTGNQLCVDDGLSPENYFSSLLARLIHERAYVRECSIRAEGLSINGSLIGRGAISAGRLRLKNMVVEGDVIFEGAHLRTPRSIVKSISDIATGDLFGDHDNYHEISFCRSVCERLLEKDAAPGTARFQYALDMRGSSVTGNVSLAKDFRELTERKSDSVLRSKIIEVLCQAQEDPRKFIQIFHFAPGDFRRALKDQDTSASTKIGAEHLAALNEVDAVATKIGTRVDPDSAEPERGVPLNQQAVNKVRRGRVYGHPPCGSEIAELCVAFNQLGRLRNTLLIGEITFAACEIGGSLRLTGLIANMYGRKRPTKRSFITLDDASIGGDIDFRDSAGVISVRAIHLTVEGSLYFADKPSYDAKKDCYRAIERRALSVASYDEHPTDEGFSVQEYDLSNAKIGGEATFLFDPNYGPSIKMNSVEVGSQLLILPARGAVELSREEIESEELHCEDCRSSPRPPPKHRVPKLSAQAGACNKSSRCEICQNDPRKTTWKPVGLNVSSWRRKVRHFIWRIQGVTRDLCYALRLHDDPVSVRIKLQRENAQKVAPHISLNNVTADVVGHPPSSWPVQDGLSLEGLRFQRSKQFGPLPAPRRRRQSINEQRGGNLRSQWIAPIVFVLVGFTTYALLHAADNFLLSVLPEQVFSRMVCYPAVCIPEFELAQYPEVIMGEGNIVLFSLVNSLLFGAFALSRSTRPNRHDATPLAVYYLKRQRRQFNVNKVSDGLIPDGPFMQAANVLRASGDVAAAEVVELSRLRLRRRALSLRRNFFLRSLLRLTDSLMSYGFKPLRVASISIGFLLMGGLCAQVAFNTEFVSQKFGSRSSVLQQSTIERMAVSPMKDLDEDFQSRRYRSNTALQSSQLQRRELGETPSFRSLLWSADVIVPFANFGQEEHWEIKELSGNTAYNSNVLLRSLHFVPLILRIVGLLATSFIAISIVARIETIIARTSE